MAVHDRESVQRRGKLQGDVAISFLVVTWFFIALRVWTRTYVISNFGWDDSTMILAGALFTVYCGAMLYLDANGGGTHVTKVTDLVTLTKWAIVGEATYIITVAVLKLSLGIFFARIVVKPWQLWTIYITVAVNIISSAASFIYVLLRCGPDLNRYLYEQLTNRCTPRNLDRFFAFQQAAFTTITDCVFAILPIFILWNAHMSIRSKLSVGFILSLAGVGSICSMIRFKYVDGLTQIEGFFWHATNIAIWSTIEPGTGIVAGCLATLRPLFKRFLVTAQSIRLSTTASTKPSLPSSSNHKSSIRGRGRLSEADTFTEHMGHSMYAHNNQDIELRSNGGKGGDSTDCILSQLDASNPSASHQDQLTESDRQSIHSQCAELESQSTCSGRSSHIHHQDQPFPPGDAA